MRNKVFRHVQRGTFYVVLFDDSTSAATGRLEVVYQDLADGKRYNRDKEEFLDGRFVEISREAMLQMTRSQSIFVPGWKYIYGYAVKGKDAQREVRVEVFNDKDDLESWHGNQAQEGFSCLTTDRKGWKHYREASTL